MSNQNTENGNLIDPKVYKQASKRTHFKFHLAIYILAMAVLWILYFFLFKATETPTAQEVINGGMTFLKLTTLVTALWTIIIVFHFLFVYKLNNTMLDKEIKKVQKEMKEKEAQLKKLQEENNN